MSGALTVARLAYRLDGSDEEWLECLLGAAYRELGRGLGGWIATYDGRDLSRLRLLTMVGIGMFRGWRTAIRLGIRLVPGRLARRALATSQVGTMSQVLGKAFAASHPTVHLVGPRGVRDSLGINAIDPTGHGCVLALHLPAVEEVPVAVAERWRRAAAHIAAGYRLRRALQLSRGPAEQGAEAILDADGRCEHAEGKARGDAAQAILRRAALLLSDLEGVASGEEAARALASWQALVEGRWSLVDSFVEGGRRHFIARRNDPLASGPAELTLRQRQVLAYAALGHANKLIAYELGLSEAAVSNHLRRAAERLGVATRADLIARFLAPQRG